jgi:hypothetical protein
VIDLRLGSKAGMTLANCDVRYSPQKRTSVGAISMSALGHKRTHAVQQVASLFDHFVGGSEQLRINFEAQRLGGLEIDHELELTWLQNR